MFIQTEETPNPATLKFLPGRDVLGTGAIDFPDVQSASRSPLASKLFSIEHVSGVFFGADFITVSKADGEWHHLKPAILGAIMDHFVSGQELMASEADDADGHAAHDGPDSEIVAQIKELLDTRVRPAVAQDGGDITFHGFEEGTVLLSMRGACAGCPSSTMTLKHGIENMLRHYIPEVTAVEAV